jgi:hypothetical protein
MVRQRPSNDWRLTFVNDTHDVDVDVVVSSGHSSSDRVVMHVPAGEQEVMHVAPDAEYVVHRRSDMRPLTTPLQWPRCHLTGSASTGVVVGRDSPPEVLHQQRPRLSPLTTAIVTAIAVVAFVGIIVTGGILTVKTTDASRATPPHNRWSQIPPSHIVWGN